MKRLVILMLLFGILSFTAMQAQQLVTLQNGKSTQINHYTVSYVATLKKTKKSEDYYRISVSVTNTGNDFLQLFPQATLSFVKEHQQPLAYFQFVNATGKGLSATSGKLYPNPVRMVVPYKCKKCPPPPADSKQDPYNHYSASYYIGVQFRHGSVKVHRYDIRVPSGTTPVVKVIVR
jgi:hypothetical protein